MSKLDEIPYARWLEDSLQNIINMQVESICILTKTKTGEVGTGYYETSAADKLLFAGFLHHDAVIDTLKANGVIDEEDETEEDENEDE